MNHVFFSDKDENYPIDLFVFFQKSLTLKYLNNKRSFRSSKNEGSRIFDGEN
jgi:hypothetical protein